MVSFARSGGVSGKEAVSYQSRYASTYFDDLQGGGSRLDRFSEVFEPVHAKCTCDRGAHRKLWDTEVHGLHGEL